MNNKKRNTVFILALLAFIVLGLYKGQVGKDLNKNMIFVKSDKKTFYDLDGRWILKDTQESIVIQDDQISFYMDDAIRDNSYRKADLKVYRADEAIEIYEKNLGDFPKDRMDQALKDYKIGMEDFYLLEVSNQYLLDKNKSRKDLDDKNYYLVINAIMEEDGKEEEVILFADDLTKKTGLFIRK